MANLGHILCRGRVGIGILLLASTTAARPTVETPAWEVKPPVVSVVAADTLQGEWGVVVASSEVGAGALVPLARAGAGAVAWQASSGKVNPRDLLDLLAQGWSAENVLKWALDEDNAASVQVGIVDARGGAASYTGESLPGRASSLHAVALAVQGRRPEGEDDQYSMALAVQSGQDLLARRLLDALVLASGSDRQRRFRSAALLVVKARGGHGGASDRYVDLRVDDAPDALAELERLYRRTAQVVLPGVHERLGDEALARSDRKRSSLEFARVIDLYQRAIADRPGEAEFKIGLAWFLVRHRINLDEALRLATLARAQDPRAWKYADVLAEIHFERGDLDQARTTAREALALNPESTYLRQRVERFDHAIHSEGRP